MKFKFEASDFKYEFWIEPWIQERAAKTANQKLEAYKSTLTLVYGAYYKDKQWAYDQRLLPESTHKALLFDVEELPAKKCEHAIIEYRGPYPPTDGKCSKCGKELYLKTEWLEREIK